MHLRQSFIQPPGFLLIQQFLQIGLLVSHLFLHLYRSLYLHKTTPLVILARPYPTYFLLVLYMFGKIDNYTVELWLPKNSHSFDNKQIVRHAYINKLFETFLFLRSIYGQKLTSSVNYLAIISIKMRTAI